MPYVLIVERSTEDYVSLSHVGLVLRCQVEATSRKQRGELWDDGRKVGDGDDDEHADERLAVIGV